MSNTADPDLTRLLRDLTRELQVLQRELESSDAGRRPDSNDLARFTSEVAIPGLILVLETNIRVLKLLRQTIRMAEGRDPTRGSESQVRERAESLGQTTLAKLDEALAEMQRAVDSSEDGEMADLLSEARDLQKEVQDRLDATAPDAEDATNVDIQDQGGEPVDIDVDAELQAIKKDVDDDEDEDGNRNGDESGA
jgi:hypothetical protein